MKQEQEKKTKKQMIFYLIPVIIFLAFLFYVMIRTIPGEVEEAFADTEFSVSGVESLSDNLEDALEENIFGRYNYLNLNGLSVRTLGINSLNNRQKLPNGQLSYLGDDKNVDKDMEETVIEDTTDTDEGPGVASNAESVVELNDFLEDRDINFLYLLAPTKLDFYDVDFAPGYYGTSDADYNDMVDTLNAAGVLTLDMNAWFEENEWTMDDVYYQTDHHWLPQAGLAAAQLTMDLLLDQNIIDDYDAALLEEDSYTVTTLKNWFLGSHGKRVGVYYAGIDDVDVYDPNFDTDYIYSNLFYDSTNWKYADSLLNEDYIENKDLYGVNTYNIYLYGSYPLQVVKNAEAKNAQRVLVTGDSYRQVWQYFIEPQFQEIYYIDLRYYTDGTFAQYVEEIDPDIVIMCTNNVSDEELYQFGVEDYLTSLDRTLDRETETTVLNDAVMDAQEENDDAFLVLCDELEPDQTYTLTVDETSYAGGEDLYIQMTLQDCQEGSAIVNRYFDANSSNPQKWIFTTPEDSEGSYAIYLYAGTKGHTANVSVEVKNICLETGIVEN